MSSTISNEQAVLKAEAEIERLKGVYWEYMKPISVSAQLQSYPSLDELLECQNKANSFFNFAEQFVGSSGLLGAHEHGKWVSGFAETCHSLLEAYVVHICFLRSYKEQLGGDIIEPSKHAYANMQRMVKEYLGKKDVAELRKLFEDNGLPIYGFTMAASKDVKKVSKAQRITNLAIGTVAFVSLIVLAIVFPNPTPFQTLVFRAFLALGIAALVSEVPGFFRLNADVRGWGSYFTIVAGGALGIFFLIWFVNPPALEDQPKEGLTRSGHINPASKAGKQ